MEEKVLSNFPALIGSYVMCMQQIPFKNGVTVGQPAVVNSTGIFPTTTANGAINSSGVVVESDSDDLSKESDFEIEENEFLDFGMME